MSANANANTLTARCLAWFVHIFTASGAVLGLFALERITHGAYITAFWLMGGTIIIDALDGTLARKFHVKTVLPNMDGALLDNMVDYINYVLVPAYFLLVGPLMLHPWNSICPSLIVLASAYQFCQTDAKTNDYFFKGFPSYWNITVFYLYFWGFPAWLNVTIILFFTVGIFIPIKYIYLSRLHYLSHNPWIRKAMLAGGIAWALATFGLMWYYPERHSVLVFISMGYVVLYYLMSFYRTLRPLEPLEEKVL